MSAANCQNYFSCCCFSSRHFVNLLLACTSGLHFWFKSGRRPRTSPGLVLNIFFRVKISLSKVDNTKGIFKLKVVFSNYLYSDIFYWKGKVFIFIVLAATAAVHTTSQNLLCKYPVKALRRLEIKYFVQKIWLKGRTWSVWPDAWIKSGPISPNGRRK